MAIVDVLPGDFLVSSNISSQRLSMARIFEKSQRPLLASVLISNGFGQANAVALKPDLSEIAVAMQGSPYIKRVSTSTRTVAANPGSLPPGVGYSVAYSPDGGLLAVAHGGLPYLTVYDTTTMTKLPALASPPPATCYGVSFSPNGLYLAVAHDTSPYLSVYETATWTRLNNPDVLPPSTGYVVTWSSNSQYLFIGCSNVSPRFRLYDMTTFTSLTVTVTTSSTAYTRAAFNPSGTKLALGGGSFPYLHIVDISTLAAVTVPSMPGVCKGVTWLTDDVFAFVTDSSNVVGVYIYSLSTGTELGHIPLAAATVYDFLVWPGAVYRSLSGIVKDSADNPLVREVRATDRATGRPIGEGVSAPDGTFNINVFSPGPAILCCIGSGAEVSKIVDGALPVDP